MPFALAAGNPPCLVKAGQVKVSVPHGSANSPQPLGTGFEQGQVLVVHINVVGVRAVEPPHFLFVRFTGIFTASFGAGAAGNWKDGLSEPRPHGGLGVSLLRLELSGIQVEKLPRYVGIDHCPQRVCRVEASACGKKSC